MLFSLRAYGLYSLLLLSLFSSYLLFLQFLSNAIVLLYHCLIEDSCHSDFISLWHIVPFIPHLNSFTKGLPLYLLSLTTLLNFCTNSSIFLLPYSNLFNSATFTPSLSPPPYFFLVSARNSLVVLYFNKLPSKSSSVFSFYISTNSSCIYDNTHWICSFTITPLIFILIYNLYAITKPKTFDKAPSNTCSLATFVLVVAAPVVAI